MGIFRCLSSRAECAVQQLMAARPTARDEVFRYSEFLRNESIEPDFGSVVSTAPTSHVAIAAVGGVLPGSVSQRSELQH